MTQHRQKTDSEQSIAHISGKKAEKGGGLPGAFAKKGRHTSNNPTRIRIRLPPSPVKTLRLLSIFWVSVAKPEVRIFPYCAIDCAQFKENTQIVLEKI